MIRRVVTLAAAAALASAPAAARERAEIPEKDRWNLADLYPSDAAWKAARDALAARLPELAGRRGKVGESAGSLRATLDAVFGANRELERLSVYAMARSDEDTRVAATRELRQSARQLSVELDAATSWLRPELVALDAAKVRTFLAQDPGLAEYRFFVEDALRWKPHTLGPGEERIVAEAGSLTGAGGEISGVLRDADLPWPTVKLSTGEEARLDPSGYALHRASVVKEDRDRVFDAFFGTLRGYERTLGAALYATVRASAFEEKARGFGSDLEASLFRDAIPPAVYRQLVADVRRSLPTFHRYLALRRRMLGLAKLRYQDLYVPIVPGADLRFRPEEARAIVLAAVAPLGPEYQAVLRKGFESGWTDYLPSTGKRAGAYSTGVWGVHPYQLLNFNGRYDDLSTLAHESGHSIHTYLANGAQPFATHDYSIFVAEVASTLNENLLVHHLLAKAKDDATRLFLLGSYLDGLRGTLFRQTQFADFELAFHEQAARGETLTGENLSALYLRTARAYYGHDAGVCEVPDLVAAEWAFIPHFHRPFYVYQYATSIVAATSIAKAIREEAARKRGGTRARDAYLAMLKKGGSGYPIDLLREAGVDMTTSRPFDAAMAEMNGVMDEMEKILAR
ncbi:MAG TPA: oligoendopeptidase F [Anaeromyxobacter sp.]